MENKYSVARPLCMFLAWVGWILQLAGVASLQANCNPELFGAGAINLGALPLTRNGDYDIAAITNTPIGTPKGCSYYYRWFWWVVWSEFATLIGVSVASHMGSFRAITGWLAVLATSTVLQMMSADNALSFVDVFPSGVGQNAAATAVAGFSIAASGNILLMLFIPLIEKEDSSDTNSPPVASQPATASLLLLIAGCSVTNTIDGTCANLV